MIFLRLKYFIIYLLAHSESRKSWLQRYGVGKLGSNGYQMERNVSSSEAVDPSSYSELSSESSCDDFLALVVCSKGCDIASFRVQEHWQVSAVHIVPLSIVPYVFQIRML